MVATRSSSRRSGRASSSSPSKSSPPAKTASSSPRRRASSKKASTAVAKRAKMPSRAQIRAAEHTTFDWAGDTLFKLCAFAVIFTALMGHEHDAARENPERMIDRGFESMMWANRWLADHPLVTDVLLAVETAFMVSCGVVSMYMCVRGPTMNIGYGMLMNYVCRVPCMWAVALPRPPHMLWRWPGLPLADNDFYYSGHISIPIFVGIHLHRRGHVRWAWTYQVLNFIQFFFMLAVQCHWTADLITGIFSVFCFQAVADRYADTWDRWWERVCRTVTRTDTQTPVRTRDVVVIGVLSLIFFIGVSMTSNM